MGKPTICICENKDADAVTAKLISAFIFAKRIVQSLFYLYPKFQASSSFLCLYRPVYVGPVRKPHCWFSYEVAHIFFLHKKLSMWWMINVTSLNDFFFLQLFRKSIKFTPLNSSSADNHNSVVGTCLYDFCLQLHVHDICLLISTLSCLKMVLGLSMKKCVNRSSTFPLCKIQPVKA